MIQKQSKIVVKNNYLTVIWSKLLRIDIFLNIGC